MSEMLINVTMKRGGAESTIARRLDDQAMLAAIRSALGADMAADDRFLTKSKAVAIDVQAETATMLAEIVDDHSIAIQAKAAAAVDRLYVVKRKYDDADRTDESLGAYEFQASVMLAVVRTQLGDFMKATDRFLVQAATLAVGNEATTSLERIATKDGDGEAFAILLTGRKPAAAPTLQVSSGTWEVDLSGNGRPTHKETGDHTEDLGLGGGAGTKDPESVAELVGPKRDKARLKFLAQNHIYQDGSMSAFVMDASGKLTWARENAARCSKVRLATPDTTRVDIAVSSYDQHEQQWWKQTVATATFGGGAPLIFDTKGSYKHVASKYSFQKGTKIHLVYSQMIPKVRLTLDTCEVTAAFVTAVQAAVAQPQPAAALLDVLGTHGHFVARDVLVGGRVSLECTKTLKERFDETKVKHEFEQSVAANLSLGGTPGYGGGGAGGSNTQDNSNLDVEQRASLRLEVVGGDASPVSSQVDTVGKNWISTLAKTSSWFVCGFYQSSLVPTIDLLPEPLRARCKTVLRDYFTSQLRVKRTTMVGHDENSWSDEVQLAGKLDTTRVAKVSFRFDQLLDSIQTELQLTNGKPRVSPWRGGGGNQKHEPSFTLDADEDIVAIDVGWDKSIDAIIVHTSKDREFPRDAPYPGMTTYRDRGPAYGGSRAVRWETVSAPRVRGLFGTAKTYIDGIGLQYLTLAETTRSHAFLLAIEPYLFA